MRTLIALVSASVLLTAVALPTSASAQSWSIDAAHSNVGFKVRHMMVSWTRGSFDKFEGTVNFDGKNLKAGSVEVSIDAASIDTDNDKRDEHLRSPDFFDVANFPAISFKSSKIKPGKDESFQIIGTLTMHGVSKAVTLDVEGGLTPVNDPWGNTKLGFTATTKINRNDFGLSWNKALEAGGIVVGDDVHLIIEVELNKDKE